jgi:hypothetical protein
MIPRNKFPSPRQLAPVTADHENVRTGFGPEVLAASNQLQRTSTGLPARESKSKFSDKVSLSFFVTNIFFTAFSFARCV